MPPSPPASKVQRLTPALLRRWPLPDPGQPGGKESKGRVLIVAGGIEMPGVAILAAEAALRAGAGKVRVAVPESIAGAVGAAVPEAYIIAVAARGKARRESLRRILKSADAAGAALLGPGVLDAELIKALLPALLEVESLPTLILDAFAFPLAAKKLPSRGASGPAVILTPHYGEMAILTGGTKEGIAQDPAKSTRQAAAQLGAVIACKSAQTHIAGPDSPVYLNDHGHPGLGTAGSGDVLAGLLTGLCARGLEPLPAACWATWLHASAGVALAKRVGPSGFLAREILSEIPRQMA